MAHEIRALDQWGIDQLGAIIARDPVRHCYLASRIAETRKGLFRNTYSDLFGYFDEGHLKSAMMLGANVVPINTSGIARQEFTRVLSRQGRRCSSIVGPASEVLELWTLLEPHWGKARAIRTIQPMLATSHRPAVDIDDKVRYSTRQDIDLLIPACIDMFTHEVGTSPVAHGAGPTYRNRICELIDKHRSFVRIDDGVVVFKAEVGSVGAGVAQIQGVWVNPTIRGRGIAVPAMAAVIKYVLDDIAPTVALYVNDFNIPALATYDRVGFKQVDTFATVLF